MCKKYIHDKAVEVFKHLVETVEILQGSKRKQDAGYKDKRLYMIRKVYGCNSRLSYLIFIVKPSAAQYCLSAWEITAEFKDLGEELFYFIKSKMLLDPATCWYSIPIFIAPGIDCVYEIEEGTKDFSFLDSKDCVES